MSLQPGSKLCFIPYSGAASHTFPLLDIARYFSFHGQQVTIITTPSNATGRIQKVLNNDTTPSDRRITVHTIPLPLIQVGLPQDFDDLEHSHDPQVGLKLFQAIHLLRDPTHEFLKANPTDCIVADSLFPWYADLAADLKVPCVSYSSLSAFTSCVIDALKNPDCPHHKMESGDEPFTVPGLPIPVTLTKAELPGRYTSLLESVRASQLRSHGVLFNSYEELDGDYTKHFSKVTGVRAITIGPATEIHRKITGSIDRSYDREKAEEHQCLTWLNSKKPNSVLYVSFGNESTYVKFPDEQLMEIAYALESSGHDFIWVVGEKEKEKAEDEQKWLPVGFHQKIKDRGMIIKGWAPHLSILNHSSVGGFMTRTTWNSILEGISAGVPLITWPSSFEQYYNEKFVVAASIGLGMGGNKNVGRESVGDAIAELMDDKRQKSKEMRRKAEEYAKKAKKAVEEGGSSYNNLMNLIQQLKTIGDDKNN